jgi:NodT family efflux transporter outer membrane factor (OMF) lipoprotein
VVKSDVVDLPVSWEIDLWGRVRRSAESGDASFEASAADLAAAILSVQATVAQDYFQLRVLDTQQKLLDDTATAYERSLTMTNNRYTVGLAARSDVAQAEAQFRAARAQSIDNAIQRTQLEHAIAALVGQAPAQFSIPAAPFAEDWVLRLPTVPLSLPSELLERRPDIAAAERRAAAANASIGVAKAALFPTLSLTGSGGFQSTSMVNLFTVPSRAWSLGPQLAVSIFDGGLRRAQTKAAVAAYDASAATYKQTVLSAFQEVEDNLAALKLLELEVQEQDVAVRSSRETAEQFMNRYKAGTVDYLSVVTVQATVLFNERTALSLLGRRLTASVGLVKALGGAGVVTAKTGETQNSPGK